MLYAWELRAMKAGHGENVEYCVDEYLSNMYWLHYFFTAKY
jgi:hypothetical protein